MSARIAAVVLAAGTASRYRALDPSFASKLVAPFRGEPLVRHAVVAALASTAQPVVVVTGHAAAAVRAALVGLAVTFVHNARYAEGLASSLQAGVLALEATVDGVVVFLADMPLVDAAVVDRLAAAAATSPGRAIVPVVEGRRGNPVLLPRQMFAAVMRLRGDEGARSLLLEQSSLVEIPVQGGAVTLDIDTPQALAAASLAQSEAQDGSKAEHP